MNNMLYTITPLADINTYNSHEGLIGMALICFLLAMIWAIFIYGGLVYEKTTKFLGFTVIANILAISCVFSYNTGEIIVRENTQLVGKFVGYVAEGYRTTGKHPTNVHKIYIEVEVDSSVILIEAKTGVPIPKYMYLYRNRITKYDQ